MSMITVINPASSDVRKKLFSSIQLRFKKTILIINPAPIETIIFINPASIETIIFTNPASIYGNNSFINATSSSARILSPSIFLLRKNFFINPATIYERTLSSIQPLFTKELSHQIQLRLRVPEIEIIYQPKVIFFIKWKLD